MQRPVFLCSAPTQPDTSSSIACNDASKLHLVVSVGTTATITLLKCCELESPSTVGKWIAVKIYA
eukprot:scaffold122353_cov15-Tisochrysis_lutea.AAC.1